MSAIQKFFSGGASQIEIPPGEYEGPLTIRHSCIVDGHGLTLWTKTDPALIIDSPNVIVKNFRVELTSKTDEFVAIEVLNKNVRFENVEVYGNIRGLNNASGDWDLPRMINFGNVAASERNEFSCKFKINEPCRVINSVYGLKITPTDLSSGEIELQMSIEPMKHGMILYGSFLLETSNKILRRIYVSGRAQNGAAKHSVPKSQPILPSSQASAPKPSQKIHINTKKKSAASKKTKKEQRFFFPHPENIKVSLRAARLPSDMTIDAYAFCLGENKKVQRDTDLVFFNNPRHESLGVTLDSQENAPGIILNLNNLPEDIRSVVICFGIYDEGNRSENNFSNLSSPEVVVFADESIFKVFPMQSSKEKIFTALEIYRDKEDWKMHFIGSNSKDNLKQLCEFYGVEVL